MSANRWTTYLLCLVSIAACSKEVAEVRYIGKIKHTEIFSSPAFDLDSYHRPLVRQSFCTVDTLLCLEAGGRGGGLTWDSYDSESGGKLLVTLETDAQENPITGTYLFDTTLGLSIVCEGCGWEKEKFYVAAWMHEGRTLIASEKQLTGQEPRVRVIDVIGAKATQRYVSYQKIPGRSGNQFIAPQGKAVAWIGCGEESCRIMWINGQLKRMKYQAIPCAQDAKLFSVYWEGELPKIAQTEWTGDEHRCKHPDGTPMYPILGREVYTDGRSATAADIKVGE